MKRTNLGLRHHNGTVPHHPQRLTPAASLRAHGSLRAPMGYGPAANALRQIAPTIQVSDISNGLLPAAIHIKRRVHCMYPLLARCLNQFDHHAIGCAYCAEEHLTERRQSHGRRFNKEINTRSSYSRDLVYQIVNGPAQGQMP